MSPAPCCNPCCPSTSVNLDDLIEEIVLENCGTCGIVVKPTVADMRTILVYSEDMFFVTLGGAAVGDGFGKDWYYDPDSLDVDTGDYDTVVIRPNNKPIAEPGRLLQRL